MHVGSNGFKVGPTRAFAAWTTLLRSAIAES